MRRSGWELIRSRSGVGRRTVKPFRKRTSSFSRTFPFPRPHSLSSPPGSLLRSPFPLLRLTQLQAPACARTDRSPPAPGARGQAAHIHRSRPDDRSDEAVGARVVRRRSSDAQHAFPSASLLFGTFSCSSCFARGASSDSHSAPLVFASSDPTRHDGPYARSSRHAPPHDPLSNQAPASHLRLGRPNAHSRRKVL